MTSGQMLKTPRKPSKLTSPSSLAGVVTNKLTTFDQLKLFVITRGDLQHLLIIKNTIFGSLGRQSCPRSTELTQFLSISENSFSFNSELTLTLRVIAFIKCLRQQYEKDTNVYKRYCLS